MIVMPAASRLERWANRWERSQIEIDQDDELVAIALASDRS